MKVVTLKKHEDIESGLIFYEGEIYECGDYRAKLLERSGFVFIDKINPEAENRQKKIIEPEQTKVEQPPKKKRGRPKKNINV